jgi:hypothetical protein
MVGFGEDFLACTHATIMEGSPRDDMWQREAVGAAGGAGTPAPRCCLPATTFRMAVVYWSWTASMWVLGPNLQVSGASLYLLILDLRYAFACCAY